jgi:hypothetical protein
MRRGQAHLSPAQHLRLAYLEHFVEHRRERQFVRAWSVSMILGSPSTAFVSVGPNALAQGCPSSTPSTFNTEAFVTAYDVSPLGGPREFPYDIEVWFQ